MSECLPDLPRYIRQRDNEWQGADHPDGPWRPIPAPPWGSNRRGNKPPPPASPAATDLALRVQRLEAIVAYARAAIALEKQQETTASTIPSFTEGSRQRGNGNLLRGYKPKPTIVPRGIQPNPPSKDP